MAAFGGAQNRLFVIVAVGLVGVLIIGLLSIAALVVYTRFLAPPASPTVVAGATSTPVPEATATPTVAPSPVRTATVGQAPTPTRVIGPAASPQPGEATPTPGEAAPTATPEGGGQIAPTGFGPLEALLGGGFLVVVILFVRRLRMSGQT